MPVPKPEVWSDRVREVFASYAEPLVRAVAGRLYKPRGQWPISELIDRCVATLSNDAVIDRRLQGLDPVARKLLTMIAHSQQLRWKAGGLLELTAALGHADGMRPVVVLMDEGLLYPDTSAGSPPPNGFEQWICQAGATGYWVFAHPQVLARALGYALDLPVFTEIVTEVSGTLQADGLDWLIRLAVVWQHAAAGPFRETQQAEFFKRDLERLRNDPILNAPIGSPAPLPDPAFLATALARVEGILIASENELRAGTLPAKWDDGIDSAVESLWTALLHVETWNCADGIQDLRAATNPYPAAYLLALLALTNLPETGWVGASAVEDWVVTHHPYWGERSSKDSTKLESFLLGVAQQFRLVNVAQDAAGGWVVRLSDTGRRVLSFEAKTRENPVHTKTLLVQPNLEIIAYRQGLTPALVVALSQIAAWKTVGQACTLQLQPETVYRALEAGWTYEKILHTLEQHSTRPPPSAVVESLRTWANKRDRLQVYPNAALFEFNSADDLEAALNRGLQGVRVSDRILVVPNEGTIDYRHFRLIGTRDYGLPPDQCVEIDGDGVTLTVDPVRSDLLLETELRRFSEALDAPGVNGRRQYRVTLTSLAVGRDRGIHLQTLEAWFEHRTGRPLTPAVRLLLSGPLTKACSFERPLVLYVETPGIADGLMQWPGTRDLIHSRLGPTALVIAEENVDALHVQLRELGLSSER